MQFVKLPKLNDNLHARLHALAASPERITAVCAKMLLELFEYLQGLGPAPRAIAMLNDRELSLSIVHSRRSIRVWVDWPDYGEVRDGLPVMYYRLQIKERGKELSKDARATTIAQAARLILAA